MTHYHIRWSGNNIDWEAFYTQEEAEAEAKRLVLPGETYVLEQFDANCSRCINNHLYNKSRKSSLCA